MKKVISILLLVTLMFSGVTIPAHAYSVTDKADVAPTGDITADGLYRYEVYSDTETVEIEKYYGNETNLVIPSTIEGYPVVTIDSRAFSECNTLVSVTIPDSVISIGRYAFESCESLTSVTIPEGVVSIEVNAFIGCSSLESVTIPESVTNIESCAFSKCTNLKSVTILNSETAITPDAFSKCSDDLVICGYRISTAHTYAYKNGIKFLALEDVLSPEYKLLVAYNNDNTATITGFEGTISYDKEIIIPSTIDGYTVTTIGEKAFDSCNLGRVVFPNTLKDIGKNAFNNCHYLVSVVIPDGVSVIVK